MKNNIATITEQYIKLKWADECQKEYNMCTQTYERNERVKSALGVGLIYQDSESNTKLMIGILAEFDGFVQRYKRISEITDWIEAHTSDDTVSLFSLH